MSQIPQGSDRKAEYRKTYNAGSYSPNDNYFLLSGYEDGWNDAVKYLKEQGLLKDEVQDEQESSA